MSISSSAKIAATAVIHEGVTIEDNVIIHDYVVIYPGSVIKSGCEIFDHCVIGKYPASPGSTVRPLKENYSKAEIGENCVVSVAAVVYLGTKIGNNTLLGDHCIIAEECNIGEFCIVGRSAVISYNTTVGDHTRIMDQSQITGNVTVGNHVFIGMQVITSNDNNMGRKGYSEESIRGAVIEDYARIGTGANLLPNVRIGRNALVGASALVTKDVPENKLVMGVPARIIGDAGES